MLNSASAVWFEMQGLRQQYDALPFVADEFGNPDIKDLPLYDRIERLQNIYSQFTVEERSIAVSADKTDYKADTWAQECFHSELDKVATYKELSRIERLGVEHTQLTANMQRIAGICEYANGRKSDDLLRRIVASNGPGRELCEIELIARGLA
jgi:hypothetical protein